MTRDRLRQYDHLCAELREDGQRLALEQQRAAQLEREHGVGYLFLEHGVDCAQKRLAKNCARREVEAERIRVWIETIPDSLTRRAFKLRYVDGLCWEAVAARLGYTGESSARMLCDRYLDGCC